MDQGDKRREQIRKAQARRREKLREAGMVAVEIIIPKELHEKMLKIIEKKGITLSGLVQDLIKNEFNPGE